ncbi:nidogen-like isoform X1 [Vespa velutina]|uniref:nidogen-like isoform X1 n=1 Tax=Vespa velutina TaxID=202808 RepID=UPI001FB2F399|nr:nidogen-like isoform X1 [Vespa velutina]
MARDARFNDVSCLALVIFLLVPSLHALSKNDLYPHNVPGTNILEYDTNGILQSVEAILKTPIVFYDKVYNNIFVNANGVLSFARAMQRFFNIAFPLDDPVIAPLYTHVDTRASGTIYWAETDSPEVIARAGGTIRSTFKDALDFEPTHVFLTTWLDVGYYNENNDKVNTYQVAISSNGTHSFVELLYPENGIQWIQAESHPSGLPDAKAQAGFMSEGRITTLQGSGTDQIQNVDKWSNINRPGHWVFQVGPIADGEDVKTPDSIEDTTGGSQTPSCRTGATTCHSKATCIDYEVGFCCSCKQGFFGNGKSCQPNDVPLRVIGRISGTINEIEFPSRDLQCYVQTKDGRTYTALSRVPEEIGASFQLLSNLGGVIGWLFAKPVSETKNGYELTGGLFNHTSEILFTSTNDRVTIRNNYQGLDVFGQLKMEAEITGKLPYLEPDTRLECGDHDEVYTRSQPGILRTQSERSCKLINGHSERELIFTQDQTIVYNECPYAENDPEEDTTRLKFYRGVTTYEAREGIIRFAVNTKIAPLEEEDPCIQGRETCGEHSSCVVDEDSFKCVCNPGYQYLYEEDGSAICVDVNECSAGNHMCSPDAQCINQEGSHTCHCRPGFSGDGRVCEKLPSCKDIRCQTYELCVIIENTPTCICGPGFDQSDQGCYPVQHISCDIEDNCSPNGMCSFDGDKQKHVCICSAGYIGDGYNCYSENDTITEEPPQPQCLIEMCWCPQGWRFQDDNCIKEEEGYTTVDYIRDLSARPLPECFEDDCVCPWGYDYDHRDEICIPIPGFNHDTMGPTGFHPSCNVVNRCHPYAQCVYVPNTGDYECRCNPGYEGDGMECTKTEVSCLEVDICDPNASCQHEEPIAKCVCNPGYEGDGTTCSPIDECNDNSDCLKNERCTYNPTSSRYECTCNVGFSMVDGQCVVADCSTNPSQCHVNAQCVSTGDGGYKCVCIAGYHGDGVRQCVEDHIGCNVVFNCGRNAACGYNQTSTNYVCICQPGYYGDGFTCLPQSSCRQDSNLCSSDASCVSAGDNKFACVCNDGFTGDGTNCRPRPKHDANFLLVNQGMATLRIPFVPTSDNLGSPIHIAYTQMSIALDIDCLGGRAYSSDITGNRILELTYNGSIANVFIDKVSSPEGLSIDWVSRNIFWTDSGKATVEVASLETKKRKVLVSDGLVNPRGIAVHPYQGKVFWSDWNRASPKLEWANEDGTGRAIFLQGDYVKLPNSLSIDWATDELCWADAGTFTITCIEIANKEVNVVAKDLIYPFGLAISQNHYYWTDWKTHKIEQALKSNEERQPAISIPPGGNGKLYGIVVVPETCPQVTNVCQYENGMCNKDQLCLPDGQGGRTCACADDATGPCTDTNYSS